jgi:hypothetical protein
VNAPHRGITIETCNTAGIKVTEQLGAEIGGEGSFRFIPVPSLKDWYL